MGNKVVRTADAKTLIKSNIRGYSMFIILVLIMMTFAFLTNGINLSPRNITNLFFQYSYVLILAVGMVQVIIVRGIDLSVGSVCAFVGALSALIYNTGIGMPMTLFLSISIGMGIGAWQGLWVAYAKIPAFIVTLAGMLLFRGLTYIVTRVRPISLMDNYYARLSTGTLDEALGLGRIGPYFPMPIIFALSFIALFFAVEFIGRRTKIANDFEVAPLAFFVGKLVIVSFFVLWLAERFASFRGLPNVVIVLGITVFVFHFILNHTVLGRYIYAVGGNDRSAKLSGINSERVTLIVFMFMGSLAGLAAVIFTGFMNTALPQAGELFELDAIAAAYIGGVSAGGGIGSVIGVIVGGLVMSAINNGMSLMNLGHHLQLVVKALILLLAVFYDIYTRRKSGLG
ncbi:MAG: sugar ABC transporter permease [Treponema sp.]|jgi:putative multiple sugar transport system permease protein|nr:sugar ABC transporter permease [Treponema sp.]